MLADCSTGPQEMVARRAKEAFLSASSVRRCLASECEWCHVRSVHTRVRVRASSRDEYRCDACNGRTIPCLRYQATARGCDNMCRGGALWSDELCRDCRQEAPLGWPSYV